jgi:hypothetical protein
MHKHEHTLLNKPVIIYADNTSAIALTKNPEYYARTKHIAVRYHFLRQEVQARSICFEYISTKEQAADGFTKPLTSIMFKRFVN